MTAEPEKPNESDPVPAATVALLRPVDGVPFEVFLVRRHHKSRFMANAYVYPGGRVDDGDRTAMFEKHCHGVSLDELAASFEVDRDLALGLHVAAIREVFEESGALLAMESDGQAIDLQRDDERDRWETYREALRDGEVDWEQVVGWEDLLLRVDELVYFAHWITPDIEPRRYDTRFFVTRAVEGQTLTHDTRETTDSLWITPAAALEAYQEGRIQLAPPTLMTLRQLDQFHSIDEALSHFRDRRIPRVLPHAVFERDQLVLLLPGDPDYPHPVTLPVEGPTRVVLSEGRWWAIEHEAPDTVLH